MDSFWVILLFIIFAVLSDKTSKKKPVPKRRLPDVEQRPLPDFGERLRGKIKIPDLRGAPPLPEVETTEQVQAEAEILAQQERYQEMLRAQRKRKQQAAQQLQQPQLATARQTATAAAGLSDMQQAIVWAEVLGKPRAYRRIR